MIFQKIQIVYMKKDKLDFPFVADIAKLSKKQAAEGVIVSKGTYKKFLITSRSKQ